jgi:hypothetical protein
MYLLIYLVSYCYSTLMQRTNNQSLGNNGSLISRFLLSWKLTCRRLYNVNNAFLQPSAFTMQVGRFKPEDVDGFWRRVWGLSTHTVTSEGALYCGTIVGSVFIVIKLGAWWRRNRSWISGRARDFYLLYSIQTDSGVHTAPLSNGHRRIYLGVKDARTEYSPPCSAEIKNGWRRVSIITYVYVAWYLIKHTQGQLYIFLRTLYFTQ